MRTFYDTPTCDGARWAAYTPRDGDIIISTPPKCGTTWTQAMCAMIIHKTAALPEPLSSLSPWLDCRLTNASETLARLDAQPFRRIIKTHVPLPFLPYYQDVQYIYVSRDPRDAFLSMCDHISNVSEAGRAEITSTIGGAHWVSEQVDPNKLFPLWLYRGETTWLSDGFPFGSVLTHAQISFTWRERKNALFLHYADLRSQTGESFDRIVAFLGESIGSQLRSELLLNLQLSTMRSRAGDFAPNAGAGLFKSQTKFFSSGRVGDWSKRLTDMSKQMYTDRSRKLALPHVLLWLERGAQ